MTGVFSRRPRVRLVAIVTILGMIYACATRAPDASARQDLLADLSARLDEVRSARARQLAEPLDLDPSHADFDLLVGMSKQALLDSLGPPTSTDWCFGDCESGLPWTYSFYHLPPTWVGGGPELLLYFEGSDQVRRYLRIYTQ